VLSEKEFLRHFFCPYSNKTMQTYDLASKSKGWYNCCKLYYYFVPILILIDKNKLTVVYSD